jgi:hypothetical protein
MFVSTAPVMTEMTRTSKGWSSRRRVSPKMARAALEALYTA